MTKRRQKKINESVAPKTNANRTNPSPAARYCFKNSSSIASEGKEAGAVILQRSDSLNIACLQQAGLAWSGVQSAL
jgi:hypothetical protein